jgi:hypothetical protein
MHAAMSDKEYAQWKDFQQAAAEAMEVLDEGREGDESGWAILARRAITLQMAATNFTKSVI